MAIEKRIQLEDDTQVSATMPTDDVSVTPDGGAEITLTDQQEIDEATAMGMMDDEMPMPFGPHDANLAEMMTDEDIDSVSKELMDGFEKAKESDKSMMRLQKMV